MAKMHRNPSVMKHTFSEVPKADIPRSTFDRSHGHKTCFNAGYLIPIFLDEALPGDTFNVTMTGFARLATPIFPLMDNLYMDTQFFAVPIRLLWDNWERLNGAQDDPGDSTDFLVPQMTSPAGGYLANSIEDYFGLPVGVAGVSHSALYHRAMAKIFNDWYRDQNMVDSIPFSKGDGPDPAWAHGLLRRGKRHDYFTSCLPWPQKGPGVMIPLGTAAPVIPASPGAAPSFNTNNPGGAANLFASASVQNVLWGGPGGGNQAGDMVAEWSTTGLSADLSQATAATINSLRQAFQVQKLFERDARGGTRMVEILKSHWGVSSPDHRLQRAEFLGGGSTPISINPVAQTSGTVTGSTAEVTPQGNLSAFGTALAAGHGFQMSFTEHCVLIGFVSVRADLTYQQGMERFWSRRTRWDHYWPAFAHIGEQAVLNKEIFCDGTAADDAVFGYQERAAEYRYKPSRISGLFRSSHPQSLDAWHLSQDFAALPALSKAFIEENPPIDRIVAVTDEPHFIFDSYFQMHCARPMPVYSVPGLIDHF